MVTLYLFVLIPILIATTAYILINYNLFKKIALIVQIFLLYLSVTNFLHVKESGTIIQTLGGWQQYIGISLRSDLLTSVLLILTILLFTCMLLFNFDRYYVDKLFLFLFLILQGLISGIFLSNDLFNLYILIELSTIVVSILIMYKKDSRSIYDGMVYLLVNIVAATLFLFGIGLIYKVVGVLDFSGMKEKIHLIKNPVSLILPYALMITAVSLKSALMPLFSWLPKAHGTPSAPSIVSAILSGLYVKSGIYLFIRMQTAFSGVIDTSEFFLIMGFLTGIIGFLLALCQSDIKLILAYHTVSQIGLIMIGINHYSQYAYWGAVYHIINHAFFKSVLFLTAGIIIEEYKTRNIKKIRGVFYKMPVVTIASVLAILGITGAPFFNGSISKYFIQSGLKGDILEYGLLIINLGTVISFVKYSTIFFGKKSTSKSKINGYRHLVILILSIMCFIGGVLGQNFINILFNQNFSVDGVAYVQKAFVYVINLLVGIIIYKIYISKSKLLYKIGELEVGFNNICMTIVSFFFIVLTFLVTKYILLY